MDGVELERSAYITTSHTSQKALRELFRLARLPESAILFLRRGEFLEPWVSLGSNPAPVRLRASEARLPQAEGRAFVPVSFSGDGQGNKKPVLPTGLGFLDDAGELVGLLTCCGEEESLDRFARSLGSLVGKVLQTEASVPEEAGAGTFPALATILRAIPDGLIVIDDSGTIRFFNAGAEAITGFSAEQAIGRKSYEVVRSVHEGEDILVENFEAGTEESEVTIVRAGGEEAHVHLRTSRIREGGLTGLLAVLSDVSELRNLREQMSRRERLASLGELSAGVAHEIRNPLAGIAASAEILQSKIGNDEGKIKFLDLILQETKRLDRIVSNLLEFARPGPIRMKKEQIGECLEQVKRVIDERARKQNVTVRVKVGRDVPPVYMDRDQMIQVFLNLASNSLEAMPGGGQLEFAVRRITKRGMPRRSGRRSTDRQVGGGRAPLLKYVRIEVKDSGTGIEDENLEKLFDPFFTTRPTGSGLGLSICQSIIREHKGTVQVSSAEGKGTTVTVDIPLEKRYGERRRSC